MNDGPLQFARFAYPPNELGYCGPADHLALLEYVDAAVVDGGLVQAAAGFGGAWPYLTLIAAANEISDPLDSRVVEAYWIGNDLLQGVAASLLGRSLEDRFRGRAGADWGLLAEVIPAGGLPHHSFHVFCVYPWVGLLRSGHVSEPLRVLDRCRVRWGRVGEVGAETAQVEFRPLAWDGLRIELGEPTTETVRHTRSGRSPLDHLVSGDAVALHWDWICSRLEPGQLHALQRYTRYHLDLVNALPHPGTAQALA